MKMKRDRKKIGRGDDEEKRSSMREKELLFSFTTSAVHSV
jgi:hypothetical protein